MPAPGGHPPRYPCQGCIHVFSTKGSLKRHMPVCRGLDAPAPALVPTCTHCGVTFSRKDSLQTHQRSACPALRPKDPTYPPSVPVCGDCGKTFATAQSLGVHQRSACPVLHPNDPNAPNAPNAPPAPVPVCGDCGKTFATAQSLGVHQRSACPALHPKAPNAPPAPAPICTHCGVTFSCNQSLERHQRSACPVLHPKDPKAAAEPQECPKCKYPFDDVYKLKRHLTTCGRTYTCPTGCGATFSDARAFHKHTSACDYEVPYMWCAVCRDGFTVRKVYDQHMRNMHERFAGREPDAVRSAPYAFDLDRYMCLYCDKKFHDGPGYERHFAKDHAEEPPAEPLWNGNPSRCEEWGKEYTYCPLVMDY